jgi:hypothetical protein
MAFSKSRVDRAGQSLVDLLLADNKTVVDRRIEFHEAIEILDWWRGEHARPLSRVAANLRHYAGKEGKPIVAQRLKKAPTIADKLVREPKMKLSRMADIGGVRAVLPNQVAAYRVAGRLRKNWTITRFRDYVAEPKADGYRALHLINRNRGRSIEIQLRTPHQDTWANAVEAYSRTFFPGLKFGGGSRVVQEYFLLLGEIYARDDQNLMIDPSQFARMRELHNEVATLIKRAFDESRRN